MSTTLAVDGMACGGCESNVESALRELPGVTDVRADHETGTVTVEGDADPDALVEAVESAGYGVSDGIEG